MEEIFSNPRYIDFTQMLHRAHVHRLKKTRTFVLKGRHKCPNPDHKRWPQKPVSLYVFSLFINTIRLHFYTQYHLIIDEVRPEVLKKLYRIVSPKIRNFRIKTLITITLSIHHIRYANIPIALDSLYLHSSDLILYQLHSSDLILYKIRVSSLSLVFYIAIYQYPLGNVVAMSLSIIGQGTYYYTGNNFLLIKFILKLGINQKILSLPIVYLQRLIVKIRLKISERRMEYQYKVQMKYNSHFFNQILCHIRDLAIKQNIIDSLLTIQAIIYFKKDQAYIRRPITTIFYTKYSDKETFIQRCFRHIYSNVINKNGEFYEWRNPKDRDPQLEEDSIGIVFILNKDQPQQYTCSNFIYEELVYFEIGSRYPTSTQSLFRDIPSSKIVY
jgi:hypothetical protein